MRTLGFRTHVLLVLAGAVGVLASLGRPWYGPAPKPLPDNSESFDLHGPLYGLADAMQRWVGDPTGTTGWDALGQSGVALAAVAGIAALLAMACMVPSLQLLAREPLRYLSFGAFGVAIWRLFDSPGPNDELELRLGALIAFASATMLWVSAQGVANAPARRRVPPPTYTPPPPPVFEYDAR